MTKVLKLKNYFRIIFKVSLNLSWTNVNLFLKNTYFQHFFTGCVLRKMTFLRGKDDPFPSKFEIIKNPSKFEIIKNL